MNRLTTILASAALALSSLAQTPDAPTPGPRRWELAFTAGTTGLGLEAAWRPARQWRLRAGADGVIPFNVNMDFSVTSYGGEEGPSTGHNFDKLASMMKQLTGIEVDDKITMECKPRLWNGKILADFYPWADKGWRVTAGLYVGTRKVGTARNAMGEMPALLAMNIYNRLHDEILSKDFLDEPLYENGDQVIWLDPDVAEQLQDRMRALGNLGVNVGRFKDGKPYILHPDKDGMVKAKALVNAVKPYLGIGYDGQLRRAPRVTLGFDLGMLMWGGTPQIIMHDGVNLSRDMEKIYGRPGDVIDFVKAFKVYPVLSFRAAYSF